MLQGINCEALVVLIFIKQSFRPMYGSMLGVMSGL